MLPNYYQMLFYARNRWYFTDSSSGDGGWEAILIRLSNSLQLSFKGQKKKKLLRKDENRKHILI